MELQSAHSEVEGQESKREEASHQEKIKKREKERDTEAKIIIQISGKKKSEKERERADEKKTMSKRLGDGGDSACAPPQKHEQHGR